MKEEVQWQWRIKWCGRWTTSHYCTEEAIRREHPEAVRLEGSRRVIRIASSDEEVLKNMCRPSGGR